jgi:gluconokinase
MALILALDVGTSSARALAFDREGRALPDAQAQVPYAPRTGADGAVELEPEQVLAALATAIDGALAGLPRDAHVEAVATSLFWHGLLGLDAEGRPLTRIITWADTRAAGAATTLRRNLDAEASRQRTGTAVHASYYPAKLRWLREQDPGLFGRVRLWAGFGEYLLGRLFGRATVSLSMASGTGLLDHRADAWDGPMLAACGIDVDRLPRIDDAAHNGLLRAWAARWPSLARAPWLPAWGDGACSSIGSGCLDASRVGLNVGTSAAMRLTLAAAPPLPAGLWHYRVDRARHVIGGATSEGGNVAAWWRALAGDDEALEREVATLAPDAHGLTVLPFLAGERSLGWNGRARGAIVGLSLATTRADIFRALLEAVALRLAAVYARLQPLAAAGHAVIASGGALSRSPAWARIVADALGVAVRVAREAEASSRGAALLALERLGHPLPAALVEGEVVAPEPARHQQYQAALARQQRLYEVVVAPDES